MFMLFISMQQAVIQNSTPEELAAGNFTYTASAHAILNGQLSAVQVLHQQTKYDLNSQGRTGNSMLMFAALWNKYDIAEYLLKNGADFTLTNAEGETPLAIARKRGNMEIVNLLLGAGATK